MSTLYESVYSRFLKKIEDRELPSFSEEEQREILGGYLDSAIAYIELDGLKLKNDLSLRGESEFNADLENYEQEVIAMYMVVAWYEVKINSLEHIVMFIGSKDDKWTSQRDHLNMMIDVRNRWKSEARKYFRNYGYKNNSYIGNVDEA